MFEITFIKDVIEMVEEIWKPLIYKCVKQGMYEASNYGKIRNKNTNHELIPVKSEKGYMIVCLRCSDEKSRSIKIHRIIASMFVPGQTKVFNEVNHKDGNKENNTMWNLEWTTRSANIRHGFDNGLIPCLRGNLNGMTKYDEETVKIVCESLVSFKGSIADTIDYLQFIDIPADKNLVCDIKYKKRWKHISDNYFTKEDFKH